MWYYNDAVCWEPTDQFSSKKNKNASLYSNIMFALYLFSIILIINAYGYKKYNNLNYPPKTE